MTDHDDALRYAHRAGDVLVELRAQWQGDDRRALGDEGDRRANAVLLGLLADEHPGDAVLSEESTDDPARLRAARVWIVDPLDGTREYTEGRADWAVHVAVWERDRGLVAGAVTLPGDGLAFGTAPATPLARPDPGRRRRVVVSRSRAPEIAGKVAAAIDAELVVLGSAGAKAMAVVRGDADAYVHAGGQYEWDSAAPVAVARAAGLHCSRLDGAPLAYNNADPYLPDLLVCRVELADALLDVTSRSTSM